MPKIGDSYCFLIRNDPTVCPFISPDDEVLLSDLTKRLRHRCLACDFFRQDLDGLRQQEHPAFAVNLLLLEEVLKRGQKLAKFSQAQEMHDEMLDILLHLSNTLELALDTDEIIYKGLVAFTAGTSFGFNRGLVLLEENGQLHGAFALGPRDSQEAERIWGEIVEKGITTIDLLSYSAEAFGREREKFQGILRRFSFGTDDAPFNRAFDLGGVVVRVGADDPVAPALREFYGQIPFWVVPLFSLGRIPLGVILVDNFLTPREVSVEDTRAMQIFAREISLALERGVAYQQLEEKIQNLQQAQRRIREDQELILKLKEGMAAGEMVLQLTHSIKNPIVAIGGLARQLNRKLGQNSTYAKYVTAIVQESSRLEEMLKDFVKFVDAQYASEREPVLINQVVDVLFREKERLFQAAHIDCRLRLGDGLRPILGNNRQVYNCLENLINNSIEAMTDGGDLFIETGFDGSFVTIKVRDTGPGMPEEALNNLFKPFFTTKPIGSGLGLYTAKGVIEGLGGSINVICEPGAGCAVYIRIPPMENGDNGNNSGHR
jgi:hypothetical protein